ncbi:MAG: c-type cytochrome, partial [Methyloglobulus sp.]|nr:c-type cytochrome [Methyloglobulus sp.]
HGPSGEGNKPATFPALRSQHADYLIKTLTDFKSGTRSKNTDNMMYMITKKMTDDEIKAVSYYISTMK